MASGYFLRDRHKQRGMLCRWGRIGEEPGLSGGTSEKPVHPGAWDILWAGPPG